MEITLSEIEAAGPCHKVWTFVKENFPTGVPLTQATVNKLLASIPCFPLYWVARNFLPSKDIAKYRASLKFSITKFRAEQRTKFRAEQRTTITESRTLADEVKYYKKLNTAWAKYEMRLAKLILKLLIEYRNPKTKVKRKTCTQK